MPLVELGFKVSMHGYLLVLCYPFSGTLGVLYVYPHSHQSFSFCLSVRITLLYLLVSLTDLDFFQATLTLQN